MIYLYSWHWTKQISLIPSMQLWWNQPINPVLPSPIFWWQFSNEKTSHIFCLVAKNSHFWQLKNRDLTSSSWPFFVVLLWIWKRCRVSWCFAEVCIVNDSGGVLLLLKLYISCRTPMALGILAHLLRMEHHTFGIWTPLLHQRFMTGCS